MGTELIWAGLLLLFGYIAILSAVLFAPTLLALALRRESIFSIMAVNFLPSLVGWTFLGWAIAFAWAIFGAKRAPRAEFRRSNWDILP